MSTPDVAPSATAIQERRPLNPADLFRLRLPQSADLSPDAGRVILSIQETDTDADADRHHLYLMDVAAETMRRLTFGPWSDKDPRWSPDGRRIAFISTRDEQPQIYLMDLDGGEARRLTDLPQGVGGAPVWSPDGERLAFTAGPHPDDLPQDDDPYRITRKVYRFDNLGYLDRIVQDLYVVEVASDQVRKLTADTNHNVQPQWSPDGTELLFAAGMFPDSLVNYLPRVAVIDLEGNIRVLVDEEWGHTTGAMAWSADGAQVLFSGRLKETPIGAKADLYMVDRLGELPPVNRSAGFPYGFSVSLQPDLPADLLGQPARILLDGAHSALVQAQIGGSVHLYRVALQGDESCRPVVTGERAALPLAVQSGKVLMAVCDFQTPLDLWLMELVDSPAEALPEQRLTRLNADLLAEIALPTPHHLRFPGTDGVEVEGWFLEPVQGEAPYPTVLYIHGGPHGAFGNQFHGDMQMLAGAGYGVLAVNHRASTGYGDAFSTAIKGDWGNLDYTDLMAGVDDAIARGLADPERLGVCGLSGGGNLSCWIVGQTARFRAAVPENPVTNWTSFYGTSDIGVWFSVEQLGGHPHEIPEVYARCSPITYAHRCTTPTLLVQCEADYRCPAEQSEQFFSVLQANGCPVEMMRLPGVAHGGAIRGAPKIRRAQNDALLGWMNRWVLD